MVAFVRRIVWCTRGPHRPRLVKIFERGRISGFVLSRVSAVSNARLFADCRRDADVERLHASPHSLGDRRGAELSEAAARLSRILALTIQDVRRADGGDACARALSA
jgi:hypothetical protein